MPTLGITSLCSWKKHITLISLQVLSEVWKTSLSARFITAYTGEKRLKKQIENKRTWYTTSIFESG